MQLRVSLNYGKTKGWNQNEMVKMARTIFDSIDGNTLNFLKGNKTVRRRKRRTSGASSIVGPISRGAEISGIYFSDLWISCKKNTNRPKLDPRKSSNSAVGTNGKSAKKFWESKRKSYGKMKNRFMKTKGKRIGRTIKECAKWAILELWIQTSKKRFVIRHISTQHEQNDCSREIM